MSPQLLHVGTHTHAVSYSDSVHLAVPCVRQPVTEIAAPSIATGSRVFGSGLIDCMIAH